MTLKPHLVRIGVLIPPNRSHWLPTINTIIFFLSLSILTTQLLSNPSTQPNAMSHPDLPSPLNDAYTAFNNNNLDNYLATFAPDGILYDPIMGEGVSGLDLREYMGTVFDAFPDISADIKRVITTDSETAVELTYTGTHTGTFEGIAPTGNYATLPVVTIIIVSEKGITYWHDYWDQQSFASQLGLTFPNIIRHLPKIMWTKIRHP